jgi:hypothetical protein
MFGVEINYKNGKKDWIDPVASEPIEKDGVLTVTNDCYSYEYSVENLEKWFKYDLCKNCKYDVRTHDCSDNECLNPRHT